MILAYIPDTDLRSLSQVSWLFRSLVLRERTSRIRNILKRHWSCVLEDGVCFCDDIDLGKALGAACEGKLYLAYITFTDQSLEAVARLSSHVKTIDLHGCEMVTNTGIVSVAEHCSGLTNINLLGCPIITEVSVGALVEHCPELTSIGGWFERTGTTLTFYQNCISAIPAMVDICDITKIDVSCCSSLDETHLTVISENCPGLTHIILGSCDITYRSIATFAEHCTELMLVDMHAANPAAIARVLCPHLTICSHLDPPVVVL